MSDPVVHASRIENIPLEQLRAHPRNARTHPENQLASLERIIRDSGFTSPLLIDERDVLIGGHGRLLVAARLGMKTVPCVRVTGLSPEQITALRLSDNQVGLLSGWDSDLLRQELSELKSTGFDLGLTGFELEELQELFASGPQSRDPEATPAAPADPVTQPGDLWLMGDHRLICGSSTDAPTVERLLEGARPALMATDPPYGVEYDPAWRNSADRSTKIKGRKIGATAVGTVQNDTRSDWREAWALFPGDVAYVWHAGLHAAVVAESLQASGFEIRSQIVWNKQTHIIGRGDYHWKHEPCWYAVRKGKPGRFNRAGAKGRRQNTVWDIVHRASETGHSTQKPIDCMRRPIENNSKVGEAVYEPFAGSFTTGIAAQMTGRRCYAVEIDPAYCDVGVLRWQTFTGHEATLEETGETFAQVAERRIAARGAAE